MKALLLSVILLVGLSVACVHVCKDFSNSDVPGCSLSGKGCKCLFEHKYQVTIKDPVSGTSGSSPWEGNEQQAGLDAVYQLFLNDRGCNCKTNSSIPSGSCTLYGQGCFFFNSTATLSAKAPSYRFYAQILAPQQSALFEQTAESTGQIETAVLSLFESIVHANPACTPTSAQRHQASRLFSKMVE